MYIPSEFDARKRFEASLQNLQPSPKGGLKVSRTFTGEDSSLIWEKHKWIKRDASIKKTDGSIVFEQKDVLFPEWWSQTAVDITVQKYFRGVLDTEGRETSLEHLVSRVVDTIARWGVEGGYFATVGDAIDFRDELIYMVVHQMMAFNSPVWFNVGVDEKPQCSACFINSVEDSMESILDLAKTEGMIFKRGSGAGSNLSALRGAEEGLEGGGSASGPVSFMKGFDAFAGVIKSGGRARRAAKMIILDADHPDIEQFITCKAIEEKKAWALIDAGYDGNFNVLGGAYDTVGYQNANHSVRVTDDFMRAVENDEDWDLIARVDGRVLKTVKARELFRQTAESAHLCGDPGIQFDTTINNWHTCPETARLNSANPCGEYNFLDDSACNLASHNLMKYRNESDGFNTLTFGEAVRNTIIAMEIIVGNSSYPTPKIEQNSHDYRPLGLGFANLGALLMTSGLAYNSNKGRSYAASITAFMTGKAYLTSTEIAKSVTDPFAGFEKNQGPFLKVMLKHQLSLKLKDVKRFDDSLSNAAHRVWDAVLNFGGCHGFRNAQISVLAPCGTIAFMMDCDTTGIEPDIALVKYKKLVGGGTIKIVNQCVPEALRKLGYDESTVSAIIRHVHKTGTVEGAEWLKDEHLPVFDCALKPENGSRSIEPMGHVKMMAAVQPFISGAISKTVNMPADSTVEDVEKLYIDAWKLGIKALAIYRDGSKRTQPLSTKKEVNIDEKHVEDKEVKAKDNVDKVINKLKQSGLMENFIEQESTTPKVQPVLVGPPTATRRKLETERSSKTHRFSIGGHEGYITVGLYPNGQPGEVFITMAKEGSAIYGLMHCFAISLSIGLQHGIPLQVFCDKFKGTRFEPAGFTGNQEIPMATSVMDYLVRWLMMRFGGGVEASVDLGADLKITSNTVTYYAPRSVTVETDAPPCHDCGTLMTRNGSCHRCANCGSTSGCS